MSEATARGSEDTRMLGDLDRLAFRLQQMVRERLPDPERAVFTLSDLEGTLLPFKEARRTLAVSTVEGYDRTVLRLVAGDGGYLTTHGALQEACRRALASPSPTLALIRAWSATPLFVVTTSMAPSFAPEPSPPDGGHAAAPEPTTCRYCAGTLPRRPVTYCPHCGVDLTRQQCPACSTELEVGWKFCVTCGRAADPGPTR